MTYELLILKIQPFYSQISSKSFIYSLNKPELLRTEALTNVYYIYFDK